MLVLRHAVQSFTGTHSVHCFTHHIVQFPLQVLSQPCNRVGEIASSIDLRCAMRQRDYLFCAW